MHFLEILGSKSKQQNSNNFNEIALIFRHPSMPSVDDIDGCRNVKAISLKFLLFFCFDFDPKISRKCIYSVYHLFHFHLDCRMVQDLWSTSIV